MVNSRRRVSYVLPPPNGPIPRFQLPPNGISRSGSISPLLLLSRGQEQPEDDVEKRETHPRHRLGVASLALDTSTQLAGRNAPEGILYSGGRDGLVMSWDLGIPMRKRKVPDPDAAALRRSGGRWEVMTGWADDAIQEEGDEGDERPTSDGDVLGDVVGGISRRKRTIRRTNTLPFEHQWETDIDAFKPGKSSEFRQCTQTHTDWVNDILLCNYNQTLVSASSDGTVKAWNPHSPELADPNVIGTHSDYVRCLAYCREQNWVASGSFDRTIKLWDLNRTSTNEPLITLNPPDATAPKSSIYAMACDPFGHSVASGSPERVIRIWDPRSGKRTGKLVGHTDNIRAILISEDSKYLLTGSADASIKLWSLSSQRCLHTFTHHADSVWSLFSSHPSLEIFYSGDKSGLVCKVDVEDCSDVSEGECIVLCQDSGEHGLPSSEGVNKIVAMDDNLLWTASGSSSIKRWRVPQRRAVRATALITDFLEAERPPLTESPIVTMFKRRGEPSSESSTRPSSLGRGPRTSLAPSVQSLTSENWLPQKEHEDETTLYGIPFGSLVKLTSAHDTFTPYSAMSRGRDPEVATLYSAASVMSVPHASLMRSPIQSVFHHHSHTSPLRSSRTEDTVHPVHTARADYEDRELAADAIPLYTAPDSIIPGDHGLVRSVILNDRIHALTVDTSGEVAVWDIVRGVCRGKFSREDVAAASHNGSSLGSEGHGIGRERSPREALETVRERIEGEAVVVPWSSVDTKTGVLTVHLREKCFESEVYADEVGFGHDRHFNEESRLNIGKWVLRNLFLGFIREEQRTRRNRDSTGQDGLLAASLRRGGAPHHIDIANSNTTLRRSISSSSRTSSTSTSNTTVIASPRMIPALSPSISSSSLRASPLLAPMIPLHPIIKENSIPLPSIPHSPVLNVNDVTPTPIRRRSAENGAQPLAIPSSSMPNNSDYFTQRTRQGSMSGGAPPTPDDFSGWGGPGSVSKLDPAAQIPSTPTGLMGRLKNFGKISKKSLNETNSPVLGPTATPHIGAIVSEPEELATPGPPAAKTALQVVLANHLSPPSSGDAPLHNLPKSLTLLISEEASPGWNSVWRGTVSSVYRDIRALEEAMPLWLLEYLLLNKIPEVPIVKVSFVLLPWPNKDPEGEQLPELLNTTQSKLTASRFLRVRKLVVHVQEKLEKMAATAPSSTRSSLDTQPHPSSQPAKTSRLRAEDMYEVLCNEAVLPLDMTLAAVRQFVWRQSGELTMHYRRKIATVPPRNDSIRHNGSIGRVAEL